MSRKLLSPVQDLEAVKWNGQHLAIDAAPPWLRDAAKKGQEDGGAYQSFSDIWIYADGEILICNPGDYLVYFPAYRAIVPMKKRAFFLMMGGPVHEL